MRVNEILNEGLLSNAAKAVKRAVVGWGMFDKLTPAELKKKVSELSDAQLRLLAKSSNDSAMKSSPRDLQMKLIQREILRRQAGLKEDSHSASAVNEGWKVIVRNKDGKEKRFPSGQENSPEALAWKNSSSKKSLPAYSDAYWEKKKLESADPSFKTPWTPIDLSDDDSIDKIVRDQFDMNNVEWAKMKKGETKRDGTRCATRVIRVTYEIGLEDDMGVDDRVQETQHIIVARNPKNPKKIDFLDHGKDSDKYLGESERWSYYTDKHGNKWKNNDEYRVNLTTGEEFNLDGTPVWSGKKRKTEKTRYYYEVPFAQKEKAKSFGMRWDPEKKKWYSEDPNIDAFKRV